MAITELTRIDKSIRNGNANSPSVGCGGVFVAAGQILPPGDYVAIQLLGNVATLSLTLCGYISGRAIHDINGVEKTAFNLIPTKGEALWWIPMATCKVAGAAAIFYRRCN